MINIKLQLKKWLIILLVLMIPSFLLLGIGASQATLAQEKQKGMSFAAWWPGLYSSPDADQALTEAGIPGELGNVSSQSRAS